MDEETRLIRAGKAPKTLARTVGPPIQRGSTVLLPNAKALYEDPLSYGRSGLAAQSALQDALCELEGAAAVELYPSGLAAMTGAMLAVLDAGDEVLVTDAVYKPTRRFCDGVLKRFGVTTRYFDPAAEPDALMALAGPKTRLIVLESPASLTFEMQDVPAIAAAAKAEGIWTLIDNTWAAGLYFKPLAHGVDISIQALTKYVGGHSDVFMGSAATADPKLARKLADGILHLGWSVDPEAAYDMLRGLRTLPTRMAQHDRNTLEVARWMAAQPQVQRILHPAMPGSPGHELWKRDYTGAPGLFTAILTPAPQKAVHALLDALEVFGLGFSWGGFESLAIHCDPQLANRTLTHDYGGPTVRFHIGLESPADLIADLVRGLKAFNG